MRYHHYRDRRYFSCGYASGLFYIDSFSLDVPMICNPITGGYTMLPYISRYRKKYSFFGFDPIDKQYKVLFMAYPDCEPHGHQILTLGTEDRKWRTLPWTLSHDIKSKGICINGVLYYLGESYDDTHETSNYVIVCFDVRSEKFTFIDVERICRLINYNGKLALIYWEDDVDIDSEDDADKLDWDDDVNIDLEDDVDVVAINEELCVWVLEDVDKQEWSKYAYTLNNDKFFRRHVSVVGVGEIVFSMREYKAIQPFYVFYFNPEKNNLQCVEIQGFGEVDCSVYTFADHVEDLNINDPKPLNSFHTPYEETDGYQSYSDSEWGGDEDKDNYWS